MNESEMAKELLEIKERNKRVELDKAWERSYMRRFFIAFVTYVFACIWLYTINESGVYLKAVIPVAGYILSTLSIPYLKKYWLKDK